MPHAVGAVVDEDTASSKAAYPMSHMLPQPSPATLSEFAFIELFNPHTHAVQYGDAHKDDRSRGSDVPQGQDDMAVMLRSKGSQPFWRSRQQHAKLHALNEMMHTTALEIKQRSRPERFAPSEHKTQAANSAAVSTRTIQQLTVKSSSTRPWPEVFQAGHALHSSSVQQHHHQQHHHHSMPQLLSRIAPQRSSYDEDRAREMSTWEHKLLQGRASAGATSDTRAAGNDVQLDDESNEVSRHAAATVLDTFDHMTRTVYDDIQRLTGLAVSEANSTMENAINSGDPIPVSALLSPHIHVVRVCLATLQRQVGKRESVACL